MKAKLTNFSLIICAILACVGTYITLGQTGIFKFFLAAPICALIIGMLKGISVTTKAAVFSLFSLIYAFVFLDGQRKLIAFLTMVAIILSALFFGKFIDLIKKKRIFILPSMLCALVSVGVTIIFFGAPTTALGVKNELDEYISSIYAEDEFIIDDFDFDGKIYGYTVTAKNDRTASGIRIYKSRNGVIVDEYLTHLKKSLMRPTVEDIITVLRENHPDDGFSIYGKEIHALSYPLSVYDENDYSESMDLYLYVSNEMLFEDFVELTRSYFEEIMESGIKFNTITFIGGEKGQKIFEVTARYGYVANTFDKLVKKYDHVEFSLKHIDFK